MTEPIIAPEPQLLVDEVGLLQAVQGWTGVDTLYLDTEFVRTRTYYARPGLLQLRAAGVTYLIDLVRVEDLSRLSGQLSSPSVTKVLHAGSEDLALLFQLTGTRVSPVFDTQVAAAYCGIGTGIGYRNLVHRVLGLDLDKSETRSDWCQRPLTRSQLGYAAQDVSHLPALQDYLQPLLDERGYSAWAAEDFARQALLDERPEEGYRRLRLAARLDRRQLAILERLWSWREQEARDRDRPRNHVVRDEVLCQLAVVAPTSAAALGNVNGLAPIVRRRASEAIIDCISDGLEADESELPPPTAVPASYRGLIPLLKALVAERAGRLDLPASLVAGRRSMEALLTEASVGIQYTSSRLVRGWRGDLLEEPLRKVLGGAGLELPETAPELIARPVRA